MTRAEELALIQQAQRGNREAFGVLYQAHLMPIYRYVLARVTDPQVAEDLTSDVFARVIAGLGTYKDEGLPLVAWLYRIAHDRVIDHYRKTRRQGVATDLEAQPLGFEVDFDEQVSREQIGRVLAQAMDTLTDEQRTVLQLRFIEGDSLEQTAQRMGKNANAIKALQHRAVRALAQRLAKNGVDVQTLLMGLS